MRLRDLQFVAPSAPGFPEQRTTNMAFFATFEPIRLGIKARRVEAPFAKIVMSFAGAERSDFRGHVMNVLGICEVTEVVDLSVLAERAGDHRWVLERFAEALEHIEQAVRWKSPAIVGLITAASQRAWPLVHFFERFQRLDRSSGVTCTPWLSARPGETHVGVRFVSKTGDERNVAVASEPNLYLEDSFPLAKVAIRRPNFVLMDWTGATLASLPIDSSAFH